MSLLTTLKKMGCLIHIFHIFLPLFKQKPPPLLNFCFEHIENAASWGAVNEYKVHLLCFVKLLHGFVCASDYDSNDFYAPDVVDSLGIDYLYLGGLLSTELFEELSSSNYEAEDDYELRSDFLDSIAREQVSKFVLSLSERFGVAELCAIFWWCLWPDYSHSAQDKFDTLFNNVDFDFSPELFQVYSLLEDGWSDYADND